MPTKVRCILEVWRYDTCVTFVYGPDNKEMFGE